jgi:predicted XRE-type DNA-binding protein
LRDESGKPAFAVIPFDDFQAMIQEKDQVEVDIPTAVRDLAICNKWSLARAWREHKQLTQAEIAQRMWITEVVYAQLEAKKRISKFNREKIAYALEICESQLTFLGK